MTKEENIKCLICDWEGLSNEKRIEDIPTRCPCCEWIGTFTYIKQINKLDNLIKI